MARPDDRSRRARRDAADELCGVDLILECERAASRRNPRDRDPKRWSKTAWRLDDDLNNLNSDENAHLDDEDPPIVQERARAPRRHAAAVE